ncbi:MAG: hypothetical protein IPM59_15170 [Chloracidobacterium sp.]|nr:hypothetical protein [Chloracidobacterium sp.]
MNGNTGVLVALFVLLTIGFGGTVFGQNKGTVITVNDIGDSHDAAPGDGLCRDAIGKCTLRAALEEANATTATDAIIFDVPVPAVITLTIGELLVTNQIGIFGRGARRLSIMRDTTPNFPSFRIFNLAAPTFLRGMTIANGHSFTNGGGILASKRVDLKDLAISGNRAEFGAGIAFQGDGISMTTTIVERCLLNGNTATGQGGGIFVGSGMGVTIMSAAVTNNSAQIGGGLANLGTIAMANNTISGNHATAGASGIKNHTGGTVYPINTIFGRDTGQSVPLVEGEFDSMGDNLVTNTSGSGGWTSSDITSPNNSLDPMLAPLANNGGQLDSIALMPGSPAIEAGHPCVTTGGSGCGSMGYYFDLYYDQRGAKRGAGLNVDIGSYEFGSGPNTAVASPRFYGQSPASLAYSRVIVTDVETLEERSFFVVPGLGTAPIPMDEGSHYLIDVRTKRNIGYSIFRSLNWNHTY